jgi:hypothetical protein
MVLPGDTIWQSGLGVRRYFPYLGGNDRKHIQNATNKRYRRCSATMHHYHIAEMSENDLAKNVSTFGKQQRYVFLDILKNRSSYPMMTGGDSTHLNCRTYNLCCCFSSCGLRTLTRATNGNKL